MPDTYPFRREDNGEIVQLPFDKMMEMDACGCVTLPDGVMARRARGLEQPTAAQATGSNELNKPIISDALGFTETQLQEFEVDRVSHGFSGVEFVRDPRVPQFFQVKIKSQKEWARYVKHRGMFDQNSRNGGSVCLTPQQLQDAKERILARYGANLPEFSDVVC